MIKKIKTISKAEEFINSYIPQGLGYQHAGEKGLKRIKYVFKNLGNPQNKMKVIHIAGTSGKGSTATLISLLLRDLGFKVGLHVSPHLIDIRERYQIDNKLVSEELFIKHLNMLLPFLIRSRNTPYGSLTYSEINVVIAYYIFFKEKMDYVVMETDMGGSFDSTNVVDSRSKLAVITRIGHDHTHILGKRLNEIAEHKAGIIQKGNLVVALRQRPSIQAAIEKQAKDKKGKLYLIQKGINIKKIDIIRGDLYFDFSFMNQLMTEIKLGLKGYHQAENCSLALASVKLLSVRDKFAFDGFIVRETLKNAKFPGRLDTFEISKKIIVADGAHNPQKMKGLAVSLKSIFPSDKLDFVIAIKKGKDYKRMLSYVVPLANSVCLTTFIVGDQDNFITSDDPTNIKKQLSDLGFDRIIIVEDPMGALERMKQSKYNVVITGSLYLLSCLYPILKGESGRGV